MLSLDTGGGDASHSWVGGLGYSIYFATRLESAWSAWLIQWTPRIRSNPLRFGADKKKR